MDYNSPVALTLYCLLACCLIMLCVWLWAHKIKNAGVVDIFWSYNFPVIALILLLLAPGFETRKLLICGMVIIAGMRLGTHLAIRIIKHLDEEEGRYKQLRKEWAPNPERKFFFFFQFQAVSNVLLAVPFFIITLNTNPESSAFWARRWPMLNFRNLKEIPITKERFAIRVFGATPGIPITFSSG
jgi:steroid 5-alpha reductase family enzyme